MSGTWTVTLMIAVAAVVLIGLSLFLLTGCKGFTLPPVELCYVHPTYGQVCVKFGGVLHYADTLTPAQRAEVEDWIKRGAPSLTPGTTPPVPSSAASTPSPNPSPTTSPTPSASSTPAATSPDPTPPPVPPK